MKSVRVAAGGTEGGLHATDEISHADSLVKLVVPSVLGILEGK